MKTSFLKLTIFFLFIILSCSKKPKDKQQLLSKYKAEYNELQKKIEALEKELNKTETTSIVANDAKLYPVRITKIKKTTFSNYVDVPSVISSKQNVQVFAEIPGNITHIYVKEGQNVSRGQLIARQDASIILAQLGQLKSNLSLATTTFERQQRLWKQKIGSEMQYLQTKTNKESLEEQIKSVKAQIAKYTIRSPIYGVVDELFLNQGEMAAGSPIARIINVKNVRIEAQLSEKYIGKVNKHDKVSVIVSNLNINLKTKISAIGQIVDPISRTFSVEAVILNPRRRLKPNMSAIMSVRINRIENIITIPSKIIQREGEQSYVFVAKQYNDKEIAVKKTIVVEDIYQATAAIRNGLTENDKLIIEGYAKLQDSIQIISAN